MTRRHKRYAKQPTFPPKKTRPRNHFPGHKIRGTAKACQIIGSFVSTAFDLPFVSWAKINLRLGNACRRFVLATCRSRHCCKTVEFLIGVSQGNCRSTRWNDRCRARQDYGYEFYAAAHHSSGSARAMRKCSGWRLGCGLEDICGSDWYRRRCAALINRHVARWSAARVAKLRGEAITRLVVAAFCAAGALPQAEKPVGSSWFPGSFPQ
jgi:hypothetical protein